MPQPEWQEAASADGARLRLTRELMESFAVSTGLEGGATPRRYLWTDAFAVCNFLGLYRITGHGEFLETALRLVDQVHHVLGRFRPDDSREGWLSGLSGAEAERHPTAGGLRIGKRLPERSPGEPIDPRLEWDRDGQYFHYLTQWMHALERTAEESGQPVFHRWAIELASTAHRAFTRSAPLDGSRRLVWKMSVDLKRVLIPSQGQHDALDAWLTDLELIHGPPGLEPTEVRSLDKELVDAAAMCHDTGWATDDALGAGGLLVAAYRLARLKIRRGVTHSEMLERLLAAAATSVELVVRSGALARPPEFRLAFRELGLSIGLHAIEALEPVKHDLSGSSADASLDALSRHLSRADAIDRFWSQESHRRTAAWRDHDDINSVMLATSLSPEGYLGTI